MSQEIVRLYKGSDVAMLTGISTLMQTAIANQPAIQQKRPTYTLIFLTATNNEVEAVIQSHFGVDSAASLKKATNTLTGIHKVAYEDVSFFNVQLKQDFADNKTRLTELRKKLGFTQHFAKAKDQASIIELLYAFKQNLTKQDEDEIIAAGMDKNLIERIKEYADALKNANVTQETLKGSSKTVTAETVNTFNNIYTKVKKIAVICAGIFKDDAALKSQFSYSKVLANQSSSPTKNPPPPKPGA